MREKNAIAKEKGRQSAEWPSDRTIAGMSRQILINHYVNRNLDAVMMHMAPDLTWVGPLACQQTRSAEEMRRMLEPEYDTSVEMFDESWIVREIGGTRLVVGTYSARVPGSDASDLAFLQTATFVWTMTSGGPKVVHLHLSNAYDVPSNIDRPAKEDENAIGYVLDAVTTPMTVRTRIRFDVVGGDAYYVADDRILCLDAAEKGCTVVCSDQAFKDKQRLVRVADRLPEHFIRIHRSCIVNARRVLTVRRFEVVLDDLSTRPIADRRYLEVAEAIERAAGRTLRES